ncbi:MAG: aminopeptidase [Lachnospiraceae bacterium]|nr:aminopeptidase [Lachnospiraceae bacterium]
MIKERLSLSRKRLEEAGSEHFPTEVLRRFFAYEASFLLKVREAYDEAVSGRLYEKTLPELRKMNRELYSYRDPADLSGSGLSPDMIRCLYALSAELRSAIPFAFEKDAESMLIREELFLEFCQAFWTAGSVLDENDNAVISSGNDLPSDEELVKILYYYAYDYARFSAERRIGKMLTLEKDFVSETVLDKDLSDPGILYYTGEYITEVEEETLSCLNALPGETLQKMADAFTEGFRLGFLATNKDISIKKIVCIHYCAGFEPLVRIEADNFRKMGLHLVIERSYRNLLDGRPATPRGFCGAIPSRQYEFEHKDDQAIFLDKKLLTVRLEALKAAYEAHKTEASLYAGPAVMEVFGEEPPELETKEGAPKLSAGQQKMLVDYSAAAMKIRNEYIREEERSFTIIAWPNAAIGDRFGKILEDVIRLNTLDIELYRKVQQTLIDTLDRGAYAVIKGKGENRTDLRVSLHKLEDPETQSNFENCVADVNIPVGEVFTSPVLKGTDGILHVSRVFLEGLEYKELMLTVKDGMISDYSCKNFPTEKENRDYIRENILFHHETLPMGEFAIGTNTTAYVMAKQYDIGRLLPILIAEKTGPHFAFGDTCYSYEEEIKTRNPDGKELIAKDNECSILRKEDPKKAYFQCHTDVTLPYEELGELSVVTGDDEVITILEDGRFILPGTEVLNEPFRDI